MRLAAPQLVHETDLFGVEPVQRVRLDFRGPLEGALEPHGRLGQAYDALQGKPHPGQVGRVRQPARKAGEPRDQRFVAAKGLCQATPNAGAYTAHQQVDGTQRR